MIRWEEFRHVNCHEKNPGRFDTSFSLFPKEFLRLLLSFLKEMSESWPLEFKMQITFIAVFSLHTCLVITLSTLEALNYFVKNIATKGFFQFEIIINVLVTSSCFIWIPMLLVYAHFKYVYFYSAGIDFGRQNLTSTDVRFWRLKAIPAL